MGPEALPLIVVIVLALAGGRTFSAVLRRRAASLVDASIALAPADAGVRPDATESWLRRWLMLAGYRTAQAPATFLLTQSLAVALGVAMSWAITRSGLVQWMTEAVSLIPGSVGEMFATVASLAPWIVLVLAGSLPVVRVRSQRRQRVAAIEEDLPLALDLFATLAEAGLGFDSALARIVDSQPGQRPLSEEFTFYQREMLAGVPRAQALRQLARRVDVTSVTVFVSALVQAEQIGSSLAETLRHQADDMRDRRRMRALLLAQALPVKLVFPLIVCFLPGIFVATLGPALHQMIKIADTILRNYR